MVMILVAATSDRAPRSGATDEGESARLNDEFWRVLLEVSLFESKEAFVVVVAQSEAGTGAAAGNLELIDDLFPKLPLGDLHGSTPDVDSLEQFAEV